MAGLAFAAPKVVEEVSGKVIGVTDGDTIRMLVGNQQVTVRFEGIDAPELGQSFGTQSKQALARLVAGQTVDVRKTGIDAYGRTLGVVRVDGINANTKLIEDGWAWHFKRFNDDERLAKLEDAARQAKRGLWADETPLAPWEYRARQAASKAAPAGSRDQKTAYWLNTSSGVRHNQRLRAFSENKAGAILWPARRQTLQPLRWIIQ